MRPRYVKTDLGDYLVQGAYPGPTGWALYDDDQCWPGGFG